MKLIRNNWRRCFGLTTILILLILVSGCIGKIYVEDCIIGGKSMREGLKNQHLDLTDAEFDYVWDESQDDFLRAYYKQGICDEVKLRE